LRSASRNHTIEIDAKEIIKKAKEEKEIEAVIGLNRIGLENEKIADALNMKVEKVAQSLKIISKTVLDPSLVHTVRLAAVPNMSLGEF
jgi:signal recognition particle receptor subunit beta